MSKLTKKEKRKKKATFQKALPSFSFFRPLVFISHNHLHERGYSGCFVRISATPRGYRIYGGLGWIIQIAAKKSRKGKLARIQSTKSVRDDGCQTTSKPVEQMKAKKKL